MEKILTQEEIDALFRATQKGQIPAAGNLNLDQGSGILGGVVLLQPLAQFVHAVAHRGIVCQVEIFTPPQDVDSNLVFGQFRGIAGQLPLANVLQERPQLRGAGESPAG